MKTDNNEDSVKRDETQTEPTKKRNKFASWVNQKTLLSVLAGILMALATTWATKKVEQISAGPDAYSIYVVGGNKNDKFIKEVLSAIKEVWRKDGTPEINGKKVEIEYKADRWDAQQAYEVSKDIANKSDVLMVIGHFASSTTREALKHYLAVDPAIPVILTTETNPDLVPETHREVSEHLPILRLWPTDDDQAKDIAQYAMDTKDNTFWIVEDSRINNVYSHYLAEKIIEQLQKEKKQVVLWTNNWYVPPANTLKELNIQSVFFPGSPTNALIFVNQIKAIWRNGNGESSLPNIFLTDTAVSDIVQEGDNGELEGVYVTHPGLEACKDIKSQRGHVYLARDAAHIARWIVEEANVQPEWWRDLLFVQSVVDARNALINVINKHIKRRDFYIQAYDGDNRPYRETYRFDTLGNRKDGKFRLWQIRNGRFHEIKDNLTLDDCPSETLASTL